MTHDRIDPAALADGDRVVVRLTDGRWRSGVIERDGDQISLIQFPDATNPIHADDLIYHPTEDS